MFHYEYNDNQSYKAHTHHITEELELLGLLDFVNIAIADEHVHSFRLGLGLVDLVHFLQLEEHFLHEGLDPVHPPREWLLLVQGLVVVQHQLVLSHYRRLLGPVVLDHPLQVVNLDVGILDQRREVLIIPLNAPPVINYTVYLALYRKALQLDEVEDCLHLVL